MIGLFIGFVIGCITMGLVAMWSFNRALSSSSYYVVRRLGDDD